MPRAGEIAIEYLLSSQHPLVANSHLLLHFQESDVFLCPQWALYDMGGPTYMQAC